MINWEFLRLPNLLTLIIIISFWLWLAKKFQLAHLNDA